MKHVIFNLKMLLCLALWVTAVDAWSQTRTVSGRITDRSGEAVIGASVIERGTNNGVITDATGNYSLRVGEGATIDVSCIGYTSQSILVSGRSSIDVLLEEDSIALAGTVVTALGIKRSEKALGYSVAKIGDESLSVSKSGNVMNNLSGKVAGMNVRAASADAGATVLVTIRGQRSLSGDNQPLIVLDGVPVNNTVANTTNNFGESNRKIVDYGNPISDLNNDDIESISVLKGAAAAALYGSRAGNGVILITTKSGSARKGIGVSVNESLSFDRAYLFPDIQNTFGSGSFTETTDVISDASWGPRLDVGTSYVQWDSPTDASGNKIATPWVSYPNRLKDFFETGVTNTLNVAVTGANDKGSFRLSYTNMDNTGIMPNTDLKRNNVNLNAGYNLRPNLKVTTSVAYTNSKSDNRPSANRNSALYVVYRQPANIDISKLKNYWVEGYEGVQQSSPVPGGNDNPYFICYEDINGFKRDRLTGNVQVTWDITPWLTFMGRSGLDLYNERRESRTAFSAARFKNGAYALGLIYFKENNTDFLLTAKKNLGDLAMSFSVGANRMDQEGSTNTIATNKLVMPEVYNISNAAAGSVQNNTSTYKYQKRINSVYAMAQFSFKELAFLDLTARNDWSSTLPSANNSYFYPSASLSVLMSEILGWSERGALSFWKLRGNISQIGSDASPYQLFNTVTLSTWDNASQVEQQTSLKNNTLKPEISTSYEAGTEMRFFGGRLGFDFTYYLTNTKNQIMNLSTAMSSGYSSKVINAGKIQNKGFELTINATPVSGPFTWDISASISRNRNKVLELVEGINEINIGGGEGVNYYARVGDELGDMYARTWERVPSGPYKGEPLVSDDGEYNRLNEYVKIR
ncbi:MAG: SusC/RagA family TonB-linked outer membrane protein [Bacteroidales bacterium]|nr:SusC/RagA family TonB-linked outer membrane protein [Bacteroidales bacterium]